MRIILPRKIIHNVTDPIVSSDVLMNRSRDRKAAQDGISPEQQLHLGKILAESDATDFLGNRHFRYTY